MKKIFLTLSIIGVAQLSLAQEGFTPEYIENLQQTTHNGNLSGTGRYKGLSGAMGALGGDLSATMKNPASGAVFLSSEAVITGGIHSAKTEVNGGSDYSDTDFEFDQAGAVMIFEDLSSPKWKNIALSMNYEQTAYVNEQLDLNPGLISNDGNKEIDRVYSEKYGTSYWTNLTVSANYDNKVYFGGGVNFHSFDSDIYEGVNVYESDFDDSYAYNKDASPNSRSGQGVSVSLGIIGRVTQQLRLGAAYQSPTWYQDIDHVFLEYELLTDIDDLGEYYYTNANYINYVYDMNAAQKFTGSAAFVVGNIGLISADYTYTDMSTAKFKPEGSYRGENNFISDYMKGTSAVSIGAEAVLQDFRLRGGFRYEQSPFDEVTIAGIDNSYNYQPFGDLTGFSIGAGYEMNGFFVDASYDFFSRDRSYLLSGNYYDVNSTVPYDPDFTQAENDSYALDAMSFNANESGLETTIEDIKEKQGNISLSVGFRF
ncbi:hypothetical protein GO491_08925 [Flavobacteriaceae bacterium Ap0902]|nr:hypothetical protein [Flavobacteriaceae bacterium Ap0902]